MKKSQIGIYGLGVMGRNLALNFEENGFKVSVFNRKTPGEEKVVSDFLENEGAGKNFLGAESVESFLESLESPKVIILLIKAGKPVDGVIREITGLLEPGDIVIDSGNSNFSDTNRRFISLDEKGIRFVGMGISGGEEGARNGPSLMPGGHIDAWPVIQPLLEPISAKDFNGKPCCAWIGQGGAGHFIKMVHNGIEYADMQILAEAYYFMKHALGLSEEKMAGQFDQWSRTKLSSYLIEITADILRKKDTDGSPLVDKILDSAGQKGTGKWTAFNSLELGIPAPAITQAVYMRFTSSLQELRMAIRKKPAGHMNISGDHETILSELADAMLAARMQSYAEGFHLITAASNEYNWKIGYASVARIWQGGCIIRSELLRDIFDAYDQWPNLEQLLLAKKYSVTMEKLETSWRNTSNRAIKHAIPMPVLISALMQYDAIRSGRLPANLIQAQRDYFGAHTYERTDKPRGEFFHTEWIEK